MNTVYTLFFAEPAVKKKEILRYMSSVGGENDLDSLIDECIEEARNVLEYKVCYCILPLSIDASRIILPCGEITSGNLAKNLRGCKKVIVFAATVGVGIDRLIAKYSRLSPAKAFCFQALGAERVEALCDDFCLGISKNRRLRPRFSPGYGDLPLETQKMIFPLLDCPKRIGISLGDSLLMSPSKSVTAFVGIQQEVVQ